MTTNLDRLRAVPGPLRKDGRNTSAELVDWAISVIEKLPKYADAGESFVPGVDKAWTLHQRGKVNRYVEPITAAVFYESGWRWIIHALYPPYPSLAYSTPEAAEAARKGSGA